MSLKPCLFLALSALFAPFGFAADPADTTRLLYVNPLNLGHAMYLYEVQGNGLKMLGVYQSQLAQATQMAVIGSFSNPTLIGIDNLAQTMLFDSSGSKLLNITAHAVTDVDSNRALIAGLDNELFHIDSNGGLKSLTHTGWLDVQQYGQARHIQMVSPDRIILVSDRHVITAEISPKGDVKMLAAIGLPQSGRIVDMAASRDQVWLRTVDTTSFRHSLLRADLGLHLVFGGIANSGSNIGPADLMSVDPATGDVMIRQYNDYMRVLKTAGTLQMESAGFFDKAALFKSSGLPPYITSSNLAHTTLPRGPRAVTVSPATTAAKGIPVGATPVNAGPKPKILDPVEVSDFEKLELQEARNNRLRPIPAEGLDTRSFVEWVNQTTILRYYFENVAASELAHYGLRFQHDALRVIDGKEIRGVKLSSFFQSLSNGEKKRRQMKVCEDIATKP